MDISIINVALSSSCYVFPFPLVLTNGSTSCLYNMKQHTVHDVLSSSAFKRFHFGGLSLIYGPNDCCNIALVFYCTLITYFVEPRHSVKDMEVD